MSRSPTEIDFFGVNNQSSPAHKTIFQRRDFQGVISKVNPEILKTAIASASASNANKLFSGPKESLQLTSLAVYDRSAPLTIFYNGNVCVFDVCSQQAENIIKLVEQRTSKPPLEEQIFQVINQDLPLSRKKSLRRFLAKRKERQSCTSPYASSNTFLR